MNNYYWSSGYMDGAYNIKPDYNVFEKRYTEEQTASYFAGYRCGIRSQYGDAKKCNETEDQYRKVLKC